MILELSKNYINKFYNGKKSEAIKEKDGILWTDEKIKNAFNFGNGTIKELKNHINNNRQFAYFVEV